MKTAILLCGHVRSWNKNIFLNTFGDADVFIHTYDNVLHYHPFIQKTMGVVENEKKLTKQQLVDFIGIETKKIVVEDQDSIIIDDTLFPIHSDTYAQYRKFKLCDELRTAYEENQQMNYDLVIKTRFDLSYSLNLDDMIKRFLKEESIYISNGPSIYPCDQIFIAKGNQIAKLRNILTDVLRPWEHKKLNPHEWVDKCVKNNQLKKMPDLFTNIDRIISFNK
jgi:hypothetical protein